MKVGSKEQTEIMSLTKKLQSHMLRHCPKCDQQTLDLAEKLVEVIKNEKA